MHRAALTDLHAIHSGARFTVARARRDDGTRVVVKRVRDERPELHATERLEHERELLQRLDLRCIPHALDYTTLDDEPALVLDDLGPRNLADLLADGPLPIARFLPLAVAMAQLVGELHRRGVIHRDLCPANFVLAEPPPGIALVDFESATTVPAFAAQAPAVPGELEGTLAYMPPEQCGHMNRLVDRRADLYALGAVFYEMLTGQPPFPSRDPLEVVHAHTAQTPHAPAVVTPTVPTAISDIVLKLLAKMPAWRYQTAAALAADLAEAERQWKARGAVPRFELGRQDLPYGLFVAEDKLYDRERERQELQSAIDRVVGGAAELFTVSGPAGVGKSALVAAMHDAAAGVCCFLSGKGDQLEGNVPYAALAEAFRGLFQSIVREPDASVAATRDAIARAVAPNGRVLIDALPDLRMLLGEQPAVAEVGAVEAENRFLLAFAALVRGLVAARGPLILFVDDLQWVDAASLKLLRALATDPEARALLVLGAYRSDEVGPEHPVTRMIERIRAAGGRVGGLELGPLDGDALMALLCDALRAAPSRVAPLAVLVRKKTGGNPFFVRQFLGYLYRRQLLVDGGDGQWSWDLDGIEACGVTPNVVDLLSELIRLLPAPAQAALSAAACIGNRFELALLAGVQQASPDEVAHTLWAPIQEGLVVPAIEGPRFRWLPPPVELGPAAAPTYRFVHDRVQQAAYERLADDERKALHLRIGRWLERNVPSAERDNAVDAIADQLDRAMSCLQGDERLALARLNERASRQARAASAFDSSLRYAQAGLALLPDDACDGELHGTWLLLHKDAAESAALTGDHALSERLLDESIACCHEPLEQAELHAIGVRMNAMRGDHERSVERALAGLALLGMPLPREPARACVDAEKERALALLASRTEPQLLDGPPLEDEVARAQLGILVTLSAAWFVAPALLELASFRAAGLAMRGFVGGAHGSGAAYATLGVALALEGNYADGYRYGQLGVTLAERSGNPAQQARALLYLGGHVGPWRAPFSECVPLLRRAHACGLESGDLEFAAYALSNLVSVRLLQGAPLDAVLVDAASTISFDRAHHPSGIAYVMPLLQAIKCLKGLTHGARYDDDQFDEARFAAETSRFGRAMLHVVEVQTSFLLGERERAIEWARRAPPLLPTLRNLPHQVELDFYAALALVDDVRQRRAVDEHLSRLARWADNAPANFAQKRDLVQAELARVEGRTADALALYERAIEGAGAHDLTQDEALAHELCGRFHAARGAERMAAIHLTAAADGYARWGATAKEALLRGEFPALDLSARRARISTPPAPTPPLDYLSLLKLTETLTDELDRDRLLEKLVRICTEAAHAQRGVLVLDEDGLRVGATADAHGEVTLEHTPLAAARSLPRTIIEEVFRQRQLVILGDAAREGRFVDDPCVAATKVRSVMALPICRKERTLAVLYFENNLVPDAFDRERGEMLGLLSVELAIALENSRLFAARKRSESALRLVADAGATLAETLDYDRVAAAIGNVAVPALADWCVVEAYDNGVLRPVASAHVDPAALPLLLALRDKYPADRDTALRGPVMRSGRSRVMAKVTTELVRSWALDQEMLDLVLRLRPRSIMVVPLVARGRTVGVATFGASSPRRFDAADRPLAEELVRRIASALDNASLHRDLQGALHEREARDRYLRLIFRTLPGAVWALDPELVFTYASGRFFGVRDLPSRNMVGRTLYDFLRTRDPADVSLAHHLAALAGRRQSFEYRYRGRWYAVQLEPLRDRQQRVLGCVGVAFDVTERRATTARLAESEARLSAAQAVAHVGSFEWTVEANVFTWTDELVRILGLAPGEFAGTLDALLTMVHPDDVETTKSAIFDAWRAGRAFAFDHRIVRRDGQIRVLHLRGDVTRDDAGTPVRLIGTVWDVTEINEANRDRERTLSLLAATIEATADGILAVDRHHRVSVYNRHFLDVWRLPQELASRRDERVLVEAMADQLEDPDEFARTMMERHLSPEAECIDVLRFGDGRVFERYSRPQRIGDAVVGTVWSFRDISDRERLLRRALFLADVSRLLVSLDVEQALEAVAHMTVPYLGDGCSIDLFGDGGPRRLVAISRDRHRPISPELHPSVLGGNPTIYQVGSVSYVGVPLLTKGHLVGAITVCAPPHRQYGQVDLDLMEELARRASLSVENAHLYRTSQEALQARDEFLAIAAHEIRGPASSIHLAVQSLQQGVLSRSSLPKLMRIIEQEDRRLAQFVNELLDLGRMRGGLRLQYEEVDLSAVVREVTARLGPDFGRSGSSLTLTAAHPVVGQWDKFRLDQVVSNLVTNAIKFGLGNPIEVDVRSRDGRAVLSVKDHGIGIEREARQRIFRPFERGVSVRHYGGLGLGLHIVRTVVEAMGGSVGVESEPNVGSTFTVVLPLQRS